MKYLLRRDSLSKCHFSILCLLVKYLNKCRDLILVLSFVGVGGGATQLVPKSDVNMSENWWTPQLSNISNTRSHSLYPNPKRVRATLESSSNTARFDKIFSRQESWNLEFGNWRFYIWQIRIEKLWFFFKDFVQKDFEKFFCKDI